MLKECGDVGSRVLEFVELVRFGIVSACLLPIGFWHWLAELRAFDALATHLKAEGCLA